MGHDVILVCPIKPNALHDLFHDIFKFYGVANIFKIKRIPQLFRDGRYFNRKSINVCIRHDAILYSRDLTLLSNAGAKGVSCLWECHSPLLDKNSWEKANEFVRSPFCKRVVAISKALRDYLADHLGPDAESKLFVAHDPVNPERFDATYAHAMEPKTRLAVGYVGSFYTGKGWEIVPEMAKKLPEIEFHMCGGKPYEVAELRHQWRSLANVKFHGFIKPASLPEVMKNFDVGLLPNRPNVLVAKGVDIGSYTSPMKLFEYMAAGKVVLASDLANLKEVVRPEHNGIVVDWSDSEAWVQQLRRLAQNDSLRLRLIKTARHEAKSNYSYQTRFESILAGLEDL
jgi:glycosyltransferase involved in cell wall biosynthesis